MKKAFILPHCKTCQKVMDEVNWPWEIQNIKEKNIDAATLDKAAKEHGSYEALFNRRAVKYRSMGLKDQNLSEKDYRKHILNEYTFLKRPLFVVEDRTFAGSKKSTVQELKQAIRNVR